MRICVLSDVHYKYAADNVSDRENAEYILTFLQDAVGKYDLMVLNGDIFDLWYDWKFTIIKQYFPLLHRLAGINEAGCRLVLVSGNHDFWFNDFLTKYIGIELHPESFTLETDGKKMLFTHGDLHTANDLRYQIFRHLVRWKGAKWLFSVIHPDLALNLGRRMSRTSRLRKIPHALQKKKSRGLLAFAQAQISKYKYDIVCMGHNHNPLIKELSGGTYANSGDWVKNHSYLEIIDGNTELIQYKNKEYQNETIQQ